MQFEMAGYGPRLVRLIRFCITGVVVTGIHAAIAATLIAGFGVAPYVANAIAFLVATTVSYVVNTQWSFSARLSQRTLRRYVVVAAFGCLLTVGVSGTAQMAGLDYRLGILLVILCVTPITFALHNWWTYQSARDLRQ